MKKIISTLLFIFVFNSVFSQVDSVFISNAQFKNAKFNNSHAGSGFLLEYKNKVYGITAKHVLFFAKTDSMKTISFNGQLKSWNFTSKTNPSINISLGNLINVHPKKKLVMPPKGDWLIFKTKQNFFKNTVVFSLRKTPLKINEPVSFLGYPYKSKKPIRVHGKFIGYTKDGNLRLDVPNGIYNGCSGGPVFDVNGKIVGIVSMGYFNKNTNTMVFEPASTNYFKKIINKI